ncbi:alpha/beta hydrolase [Gemmatimonas groenlandica]|uniref:Alpha/beta hydrolase fold domain-containing protein n=1 Tax=Gemmatimonas groenlandica TaxID=2732249 RepID=A0A6M4IL24_9BACT|nr:alpha/beta hydrolase [Gemmatimonas groenlandica]QJR34066.1 alpha/beta hydrolase fold domain-containing protein [Gemmatimonas groenlandica]
MNELDAPRAPTKGSIAAPRKSDIPEAPSRLEPATQRFIDGLVGVPPLYTLSPQAAHQALTDLQSQPIPLRPADITDMEWPVGPTGSTRVRIVRPAGVTTTLPVLMYFHGGGWVLGDTVSHDRLVRELAEGVQAAVVFVDYINSPAAKYPTQNEQAYAAMVYAVEHAQELKLDASRLAVAGDSVGGNMSAVITLLAKERGGPTISQQVLLYPLLDYLSYDSSYQKFGEGPWLIAKTMRWMFDLMDMDGTEDHHAYPLRATVDQLRGLPEALIVTDDDILQDEGEAYASKLGAAGVRVTSVRYNQTVHDFAMLNPLADTPATRSVVRLVVATLRDALYPHT